MKYTLNLTANTWEKLNVELNPGEKIRIQGASPDSKFRIEFNDGIASPGVGDKPGLILDGLQEVSMSNPYLWVRSDRTMEVDVEVCPTAASGGISLPSSAATEAKQDAQITELQAITAAIQEKKLGYARVEDANGDEFNQVSTIDASVSPPVMVVYYFDDAGVQQTPVAPINVINTKQIASDMLSFKAIVVTANYAIGETLTKRTILTDGVKTGSFWTNETTDLPISAPPSTDYEQADDVVSIKAIGDITDSPATSDIGTFSLMSLFKRQLQKFTDLINFFTAQKALTRTVVMTSGSVAAGAKSVYFYNKSPGNEAVTVLGVALAKGAVYEEKIALGTLAEISYTVASGGILEIGELR